MRCCHECVESLGLQTELFLQASEEEIRVAYKRLALVRLAPELSFLLCYQRDMCSYITSLLMQLWHPDRNPQCIRAVAQAKFQAIQQAYSGMLLLSLACMPYKVY